MINYLATLKTGKIVLWCYLIWYLNTVYFYFDSSIMLWLNALGISVVIGVALMLGVSVAPPTGRDRWQTFRLFATPFCVSSFALLSKDHNFIFISPPSWSILAVYISSCVVFVGVVAVVKWWVR